MLGPLKCTKKKTHKSSPNLFTMTPSVNSSNLDHHPVDQEEDANPSDSNATPSVGNAGVENSTELGPERNWEVVLNMPETDGIPNRLVVCKNGTRVRFVAAPNNDHNPPPYDLCQIAVAFFAQLAAVFWGNVTNKPPPCPCSSSHSHSSDNNWAAVAVAAISLVGFVVTLISIATAKTRAIISSKTAKLGFAAVATVFIISVGMTLPLHANGKIAVSVAACLPALVAIARASESHN